VERERERETADNDPFKSSRASLLGWRVSRVGAASSNSIEREYLRAFPCKQSEYLLSFFC